MTFYIAIIIGFFIGALFMVIVIGIFKWIKKGMEMKKFWMVYIEGRTGASHTHETEALAFKEAQRLCVNTGHRVFILEAISMCEPTQEGQSYG